MVSIFVNLQKQLDKLALAGMNAHLSDNFGARYRAGLSLESVLAETRVVLSPIFTAPGMLIAEGEHPLYLETPTGLLKCGLKVLPATQKDAPLLIFHHGLNASPYNGSSGAIFQPLEAFRRRVHLVFIQAPFHDRRIAPLQKGFASVRSIYQMLAGSLRMMELIQNRFEAGGAPHTVVCGVSWGGLTGILYQSIFRRAAAVIPMLASPNISQVLIDTADLFSRPLPANAPLIQEALDFTPYYDRCNPEQIFPLLAENDLFFRVDHHAGLFSGRPVPTIPESHITGCWNSALLREHLLTSLDRIALSQRVK